jgi:UDP-N-acetylglucosamine 2-epimerase (non-hydrolysing)
VLRFTDVRLVVGTRPEAIKLAPVARALAARGIAPSLILTGQHPGLDSQEFGLGDYATVTLACPGEENPHAHVGRVTAAILPLLRSPPHLLIVQGDTSSALGAALAAFSAQVPVAHVEAGLRTHDPSFPWPEEEYRTAIDAQSDLLFAPTQHAAANLCAEQVPGTIHVTGNSGIDSLFEVERGLPPPVLRERNTKRVLVTCHRRESWGESLDAIAKALIDLARRDDLGIDFVMHPNPHVRRRTAELLGGQPRIRLIRACGHADLIQRMRDADLILSDSGGIQEEAPALGVPLLVLRDKTERPEGLATGNARLVGTSADAIVGATAALLDDAAALASMARRSFPYGDGHASPRIAAIIEAWLGGTARLESAAG